MGPKISETGGLSVAFLGGTMGLPVGTQRQERRTRKQGLSNLSKEMGGLECLGNPVGRPRQGQWSDYLVCRSTSLGAQSSEAT